MAKHHQFIKSKKPFAAVLFQLQPVYHTLHYVASNNYIITFSSAEYNITKSSQHDGLVRKINVSGIQHFSVTMSFEKSCLSKRENGLNSIDPILGSSLIFAVVTPF